MLPERGLASCTTVFRHAAGRFPCSACRLGETEGGSWLGPVPRHLVAPGATVCRTAGPTLARNSALSARNGTSAPRHTRHGECTPWDLCRTLCEGGCIVNISRNRESMLGEVRDTMLTQVLRIA